jgi:hypothetical protein
MDYNDLAAVRVSNEYGTGGAGLVLILIFFFSQCSGGHHEASQPHPKQTHRQTLHPPKVRSQPYAVRSF